MKNSNHWIGVVLGAGSGKRMKSDIPKIAHMFHGKPMIIWVLESLIQAGLTQIILVISPNHSERIKSIVENAALDSRVKIHFAYQETPHGTAHAVHCGVSDLDLFSELDKKNTHILVAYGDTPCVQSTTFETFLNTHEKNRNSFTVLAFEAKNPFGYGRIILDKENKFVSIREEKDCDESEKKVTLCNSGLLCAELVKFEELFPMLENKNAQGEFYLTDIPFLAKTSGYKVGIMIGETEDEFLGINSQEQLLELEKKTPKKIENKVD